MSSSTSIGSQDNEELSQTASPTTPVTRASILNTIISDFLKATSRLISQNTEEMNEKMKEETIAYLSLLYSTPNINYDLLQQIGYVYMYVFHHADAMVDVMEKLMKEHEDFKQAIKGLGSTGGFTEVLSIGGGPGSDIVGLKTLCELNGNNNNISVNIYDRVTLWSQTWSVVRPHIQKFNVNWVTMDIGSPEADASVATNFGYDKVRLITMIKFLSAVKAEEGERKKKRDAQLKMLCSHVPLGCFILIIDNHNPNPGRTDRLVQWFVELVKPPAGEPNGTGFEVVASDTMYEIDASGITFEKVFSSRPKGDGLAPKYCHYILLKKIKKQQSTTRKVQ